MTVSCVARPDVESDFHVQAPEIDRKQQLDNDDDDRDEHTPLPESQFLGESDCDAVFGGDDVLEHEEGDVNDDDEADDAKQSESAMKRPKRAAASNPTCPSCGAFMSYSGLATASHKCETLPASAAQQRTRALPESDSGSSKRHREEHK